MLQDRETWLVGQEYTRITNSLLRATVFDCLIEKYLLILYISYDFRPDKLPFISNEAAASFCGCNIKTISRYRSSLSKKGLLTCVPVPLKPSDTIIHYDTIDSFVIPSVSSIDYDIGYPFVIPSVSSIPPEVVDTDGMTKPEILDTDGMTILDTDGMPERTQLKRTSGEEKPTFREEKETVASRQSPLSSAGINNEQGATHMKIEELCSHFGVKMLPAQLATLKEKLEAQEIKYEASILPAIIKLQYPAGSGATSLFKLFQRHDNQKPSWVVIQDAVAAKPVKAAVKPEEIYAAYPKKVARPAAIKSIQAALKHLASSPEIEDPSDFLLEQTQLYAKTQVGAEKKYIPHPTTWYNQQRYLDDVSTWNPRSDKSCSTERVLDPVRPEVKGISAAEILARQDALL